MKFIHLESVDKGSFSRGLDFERHIADLDAAIAQRRAALIQADKHRSGYIWN